MKYATLSILAVGTLLPLCARALPSSLVKPGGMPTDPQILNFALTLEHLEAEFYKQGLKRFGEDAFKEAGFAPWTRGRFEQIAAHEYSHVKFLTDALTNAKAEAVKPCTYKFDLKDVKDFVTKSEALESVGSSAYTGAAAYIENKAYLTAAASILATEARHAGWVHSAALKKNGWNTPYETPLSINEVYSLAAQFIDKCPTTNIPLLPQDLVAFPKLKVIGDCQKHLALEFEGWADNTGPLELAFISGLGSKVVDIVSKEGGRKEAASPDLGTQVGLVYLLVVEKGWLGGSTGVKAGPAMCMLDFGSQGRREY